MSKAYFAIGSIADVWCGVDDGAALCQVAIDAYQSVVALEPSRQDAWKGLAHASYLMDRIDQADINYRRALLLAPNDPESFGGLASIDMGAAYRSVYSSRIEHNVATERELIDSPFCGQIREKNLTTINEGIELAHKAREVKNKNLDLMAVLCLLHATRAQIQCGNRNGFEDDMKVSKRWNRLRAKTHPSIDQFLWNMPPGPPPPLPTRHWWDPRPAPK
ncbi:MAG: hypothetical protein ABSF22_12410 [Bryobacteraceae bacterium]